jgi:membrane fusion protein, heavy metal efflux system
LAGVRIKAVKNKAKDDATKNTSLKKYALPAGILGTIALIGFGAAYAFNTPTAATVPPAPQVKAQPKIAVSPISSTDVKPILPTLPIVQVVQAVQVEAKPVDLKSDALGCLVEPSIVVDVSSPVAGLLDKVAVERGDFVNKGQMVASLESRVERASVELALTKLKNDAEIRSAQSNEEFARKKHARNENLHRDGVVSAQVREQAETEAALAVERLKQTRETRAITEQEVHLARSQLSLKTISSPITGMVVERYLSAGERADEKPIIKVAQIDPLRVEAILPATMYGKVKAGMMAKVTPELVGEQARNAAITLVDKVIDPASNTFRVRLELRNTDYALPSGVRCKINIAQL